MKYSLIEIRPTPKYSKERRRLNFDDTDPHDREARKTHVPNSLGFLYFPRNWGVEKGFSTLKEDMIDRRKKQIQELEKDIADIKQLELPEWCLKGNV